MRKPEALLAMRVSNYLKMNYPNQPFRFDTGADIRTDMASAKRNKELHGRWNRGHPDLMIFGYKKPLLLELKATKTVHNTDHTKRQKIYHAVLRRFGYKVDFCCQYEDCITKIEKYMMGRLNKMKKDGLK